MSTQDYPGGWFGESWGAPVCEPERHKPTPVGVKCPTCDVPIAEDDQGMLIPLVRDQGWELEPYHYTCFLSMVLGRR